MVTQCDKCDMPFAATQLGASGLSADPDEAAYWPVCWEQDVDPYGPAENASALVAIAHRGCMLKSFMVCVDHVAFSYLGSWDGSTESLPRQPPRKTAPRALKLSCCSQAISRRARFRV